MIGLDYLAGVSGQGRSLLVSIRATGVFRRVLLSQSWWHVINPACRFGGGGTGER